MRATPLLILSIVLSGCASAPTDDADVVATFYPLAWATERLAGNDLLVAALVPAGIEPHDWEPTAKDAARLAEAKLIVVQGAGFEPWLGGLLEGLDPAPPIVETTAGFALAPGHDEDEPFDPHTWLDPVLFADQVRSIEDALAEVSPNTSADIRARGSALRSELADLDDAYEAGLATCDVRIIIANHEAYGYLARRYDFEVIALSGLSPEAEPSSETIARAVDVAREHDLTIIFFEELVSPRVAQIVASEVGAQVRVLSPVESAPKEGDYVSVMRQNLVHLREAMRCT